MSSYLLLRNNKETGPFTFEEMKGMTLKTYDLLWVVGKSAAWRYPGEIAELKPFAPPVPEQPSDPFDKKTSESQVTDPGRSKKTETANTGSRESSILRSTPLHSVYVNLPAERKQASLTPLPVLQETGTAFSQEPEFVFPDNNNRPNTGASRFSARVLWISTIALLFGAGILTGFFISDRRKFFSLDANHPHKRILIPPATGNNQKVNAKLVTLSSPGTISSGESDLNKTVQTIITGKKNEVSHTGNKSLKTASVKKDSTIHPSSSLLTLNTADSLRQISVSKTEALYQKIKARPDNYLSVITGTYSTGIFGGISSFPVTVTNNSPVMMDLVVVNIEYIQNNEKVFKSEPLAFTDLEPGETVSLKAPKSPRGTKIATHIRVVNIRKLDLSYSN